MNETALTITTAADIATAAQFAAGLKIIGQADRDRAMKVLADVRAWVKVEREPLDAECKARHLAHKEATAALNEFLRLPTETDKAILAKVAAWDRAENDARAAEARRLQAIEDERARKERAALEAKAAKVKSPEKADALREKAAAVVAPVVSLPPVEKAAGESSSTRWNGKVTDKRAFVAWCIETDQLEYLEVIEKEVRALATRTKGTKKVPGIEFFSKEQIALRG